uniref:hypothetical protein n=1 Tax=Streptomyces virginiae TaxID=1961 RepID=UPI002F90C9C5
MADLHALCSSNMLAFDAAEAFIDRQHQWALVAAALEEHLHRPRVPGFAVEDLEAPRTNAIV